MEDIASVLTAALMVVLGLAVLWWLVRGAVRMFAWASDKGGPLGTLLMFALWLCAFPVATVLALIVGTGLVTVGEKKETRHLDEER